MKPSIKKAIAIKTHATTLLQILNLGMSNALTAPKTFTADMIISNEETTIEA